jgi:hypothetical protein
MPKAIHLPWLHRANKVVRNNGASLVDLSDGVAWEFHSKMNTIGGISGYVEGVAGGRQRISTAWSSVIGHAFFGRRELAVAHYAGQNQDWDEVDLSIRSSKGHGTLRQFSPVMATCHGYTLGGTGFQWAATTSSSPRRLHGPAGSWRGSSRRAGHEGNVDPLPGTSFATRS